MKTPPQCPLCFTTLETRDVTPCECCGAHPNELSHYRNHEYGEYELGPGLTLVLCDFCHLDFGSFKPSFFGFAGKRLPRLFEHAHILRPHYQTHIRKDWVCPKCHFRLPFLEFVASVLQLAATGQLEPPRST
jgi:hypothetical protein